MRHARLLVFALVAPTVTAACIFHTTRTNPIDLERPAVVVQTSAKAHLIDGTTVLYAGGFAVRNDSLIGDGRSYDLVLASTGIRRAIPLDSVAGVEAYHHSINAPATVAGTTLGAAAGLLGGALLAVAIFGSCPTFYADSAGQPVLQAEAFSYSIAPLFEARDVDRLRIAPGPDGVTRLEVRNEAAETHYINHLALIAVDHAAGDWVGPDQDGRPLAGNDVHAPVGATDRSGRDVRASLTAGDGDVFASATSRVVEAAADDLTDHIDLTFLVPDPRDSVALILRARNSLLTTVLLYDVMLAGQGAYALDWIGRDLEEIGPALALGEWYVEAMGLRVSVRDGDGWQQVAWIRDVGPIAWEDIGVMLPASSDTLLVRLSFVTDAWRIDRAAVAGSAYRPESRLIPLARVRDPGGENAEALAAAGEVDEHYLQTSPGQWFSAEFDTGRPEGTQTLLLVSHGYYVEWMRPDWLRTVGESVPFVPSNARVAEALDRWREVKASYERRFFASRFPVR